MIENKKIVEEILHIIKKEDTEHRHLKEWIANNEHSKEVLNTLCDESRLSQEVANFKNSDLKFNSSARLQKSINSKNRISFVKRLATAIAACVIFALLVNTEDNAQKSVSKKNPLLITRYLEPTLILSNGNNVNLTNVDTIKDNNTLIASGNTKELTYKSENIKSTESLFNTLIVPPKFNYTIKLSDGTKVILNASSRLIYPIPFNGKNREVELDGEGYFEVSKNDKPFIVKTNGIEIKVYGTKFNVNSYNPNVIKTTLFAGSVSVKSSKSKNNSEHLLAINQICEMSAGDGTYIIKAFDSSRYQSWTEDYFYADGTTLEELLLSVSNWYDVEFAFVDIEKKNAQLVGVFDRKLSIDNILQTIENVVKVKFVKVERGYIIH